MDEIILLEKVLPSKNKKDAFELHFASGEVLRCTAVQVADFALYGGKELTSEEYEAVQAASRLARAKDRAAALLAYRAMSKGELERKLIEKGENVSFDEVLADVNQRDYNDMNREIAPLKQADDAVLCDTTEVDLQGAIDMLCGIIEEKTGAKPRGN